MKAELRTGNLINVKTLNKGIQEIEVSINTLTNVESFPELYTPIPLTEEWLVKFGFDCVDGYDDHYYNLTNLELGITLDSLRPTPKPILCTYWRRINYKRKMKSKKTLRDSKGRLKKKSARKVKGARRK
jgi:hypothetical protein